MSRLDNSRASSSCSSSSSSSAASCLCSHSISSFEFDVRWKCQGIDESIQLIQQLDSSQNDEIQRQQHDRQQAGLGTMNVLQFCKNSIQNYAVFRPSKLLLPMILCEQHWIRAKNHQSCPFCGLFCSQDYASSCSQGHLFHVDCLPKKPTHCPHCNEELANKKPRLSVNVNATVAVSAVFIPTSQPEPPQDKRKTKNSSIAEVPTRRRSDHVPSRMTAWKLISAAKSGDLELIRRFISTNGFLPAVIERETGNSLLHVGVLSRRQAVVRFILDHNANVNASNYENQTPLLLAVKTGQADMTQLLVQAHANINAADSTGCTPLHHAVLNENLHCFRILFQNKNININKKDSQQYSALMWSISPESPEFAMTLLDKGADLLSLDHEKNNSLHWAAHYGKFNLLHRMVCLRPDAVLFRNQFGHTVIHTAINHLEDECVRYLLLRNPLFFKEYWPIEVERRKREKFSDIVELLDFLKILYDFTLIIVEDVSGGAENFPVRCVNAFDEAKPGRFHYVTKVWISSHLAMNLHCKNETRAPSSLDFNFKVLCNCTDGCDEECPCRQASKNMKWKEDIMVECSPLCSCSEKRCCNRVCQRKTSVRLEVYRTADRGWGARTLEPIKHNSFVCEYFGELIDWKAANKRPDTYLFDIERNRDDSYCIDAANYGGVARFVNHSCDPNLKVTKALYDHHERRACHICFFAKRDIARFEELSFDYGLSFWSVKRSEFSCLCGSSKCKYNG